MTAHIEHPSEERRLLERILDTVEALDASIEMLVDRFDEYIENLRYGHGWYGEHGNGNGH